MKKYFVTVWYRTILASVGLLLLLVATGVQAATAEEELFQAANESSSRGDYGRAIGQYQQLIDQYGYTAPLLYNLANSYARNGQTGLALLNYERALKLSPTDPEILGNMQLLRQKKGLFPKEHSWSQRLVQLLNLQQWCQLTGLILVLLTVGLWACFWRRLALRTSLILAGLGLPLLFVASLAINRQYLSWRAAVVVHPQARLILSPFAGAASVGEIQEGRLVYPEKSHGDFRYVIDETGRKGWIKGQDIEEIIR